MLKRGPGTPAALSVAAIACVLALAGDGRGAITPEWKMATRLKGNVESLKLGETQWIWIHAQRLLKDGDKLRTLEDGRAKITLADQTEVIIGANTTAEIARFQLKENPRIVELKIFYGRVKARVQEFLRGETFRVESSKCFTAKGTDYSCRTLQCIAYVNGNDLWLMNDDGTGRTNYIAAPPGKRIGRSAFSRDGRMICYEVWDCGGDAFPETSDLWIANADGTNPRLLLSAGNLTDATGKAEFSFAGRLLTGPSFSPDGNHISCLRTQIYSRLVPGASQLHLLLSEREVLTMPVGGGPPVSLAMTMERGTAWYWPASMASPWRLFWGTSPGNNTAWSVDGRIAYPRSGRISCVVDAQLYAVPGETAWPCTFYVTWEGENGSSPLWLHASIDGEICDLLPRFKGYGCVQTVMGAGAGGGWFCYPQEWHTPMTGAAYGPFVTHPLSPGVYSLQISGSDGIASINGALTNILVVTGENYTRSEPCVAPSYPTPHSGAWVVPASGGPPSPLVRGFPIGSMGWSSDSAAIAVSALPNWFAIFDAAGTTRLRGWIQAGAGSESYVGNGDATNQRVVVWTGSNEVGRIHVIDVGSGGTVDLGPGSFPAFAPLYRTEANVFEGSVSITDTNGGQEVLCGAGQCVTIDSLQNGGSPQPALPIRGPYARNVTPAWGSVVPNSAPPPVRFEFNTPIATDTLLSNRMTLVSWPGVAATNESSWMLGAALYAMALRDTNSPSSIDDTVANLLARRIGTGQWSSNNTVWTFTITNLSFSATHGNECEVSLDLSGVQDTNGLSLRYNEAGTSFRFTDPVGPGGGTVRSPAGGELIVPAGALAGTAAIAIGFSKYLDGLGVPPTNAGWKQASGVYSFTPAAQTFGGNVTVSLPLDGPLPNVSVWYNDGAIWSSLGGTYDAATGRIGVQVNGLGTYAVFYQPPAEPLLGLTQSASAASATNGQTVTFNLWLQNMGGAAASNAVVTDVLPESLAYVSGSSGTNGAYNPANRTLTWDLGTLAGGSDIWLAFDATVDGSHGAAVTNVASAIAAGLAATDSNAAVVRVGLPAGGEPRFGAGRTSGGDWTNVVALGAAWRRVVMEMTTTQAQYPDLLDSAPFDAQMASNQAAGLRTFAVINLRPVGGAWPAAADFAGAFGRCVERYDGDGMEDMAGLAAPVHHWAIFDRFMATPSNWTGCTVGMYGQYLQLAHAAGHGADPEVTILNSAFTGLPPPESPNYLQQLLVADPGAAAAIDAVNFHDLYDCTRATIGTNETITYLEVLPILDLLAHGGLDDRPVWCTAADFTQTYLDRKGAGYTCTQADHALFLARSYPFALAAGCGHVIATEFSYDPLASEALRWAAMTDAAGHRRMSFYVHQKMIEQLEGFVDAGLWNFGGCSIGARFLSASHHPVWVLWNASNLAAQAAVPIGPAAQAKVTKALPLSFDNTGATWSVTWIPLTNGLATLLVDGSPVYLEAASAIAPDIDGDGLPNDADGDMDGDGMSNDWETTHGLDPYADDAAADPDHDGMPNLGESRAGTNPRNCDSILMCQHLTATGFPFVVEWQSVSGRTYRVEWSANLTGAWSNAIDGPVTAAGPLTRWYDTGPPKTGPFSTNQVRRYYRISVLN